MRKIILNLAVTLDGFIEGPNGEIDWCKMDDSSEMGEATAFDKFLSTVDTIFYGRVSYDMWGQYEPGNDTSPLEKNLWANVHSKKKYVFSKNPKEDGKAIFISADIYTKVMEIKNQPGKNIWLYGGAGLITSFINSGLVDSYLLAVHPVILGSGKPLFSNLMNRIQLKLNGITTSNSGVILLDYEAEKTGLH
jgi:dihydrofolate reductase